MTNEQKIDYMIQSLELAKEEITYANSYLENKNKEHERIPNGTVIRESLKMVGRMANIVANEVQLSPYCRRVFKGENMNRAEMIHYLGNNPGIKFTHFNFSNDEYIYQKKNGNVYDESGCLFEN